ncbi:MAG: type II toxin-antitoxin system PemK/MazF family toxin [Vulcanimicrobiaceae bacterium]
MAKPRYLRCPKDAKHVSFTGVQHVCCEFKTKLDSVVNTIERTLPTVLHDITEVGDHPIVCETCGAESWSGTQSISFVPGAGMMLLCDFSTGFQIPEMVKLRPVIVVSERDRNNGTCIVVAVSTKVSRDASAFAVPLDPGKYNFLAEASFAKCEMVYAVRLGRLLRLRDPNTGRGLDSRGTAIDAADLLLVREAVKKEIGLP